MRLSVGLSQSIQSPWTECGSYLLLLLSLSLMQVDSLLLFQWSIELMNISSHLALSCKMTHSSALSAIKSVGISISSSGGCSNRNQATCTSLEQANCIAINCIKVLKTSSGCPITITGGTVRSTWSIDEIFICLLFFFFVGNWSCWRYLFTLQRLQNRYLTQHMY